MKQKHMVIPLILLICVAFGCQQSEKAAEKSAFDIEADKEAIKAWYDQKTITTNAGDIDGLKVLFTDDVIFMVPNGPLWKGWEAYFEWAKPYFDEVNMEETITYEEIGVDGDLAFIRTSFTVKSTPKAGGESTMMIGKAIWIFKRQSDGSWKGSHCIWNSNT
jgi:ketosteroid isomerase-like protein